MPAPRETQWTLGPPTAKSLCASTVAFRPGSHVIISDSSPSVIVSTWKDLSITPNDSEIRLDLESPIDLTECIVYMSQVTTTFIQHALTLYMSQITTSDYCEFSCISFRIYNKSFKYKKYNTDSYIKVTYI